MQISLQPHSPARREVVRAALALAFGSMAAAASAGIDLDPMLPSRKDGPGETPAAPGTSEAASVLYF